MFFDLKKDINYAKTVLSMNDVEISNFLGISRMTLSRWQNGSVIPSIESLEKIYNKIYESGINLNRLKEEMYNSLIKENHVILFHGAKKELIGNPTVAYSEDKKDFGKGFYLGETINQAASFIVGYPNSSIYIFDLNKENIKIKEYKVCEEWMLLIMYFRGKLEEYKDSKKIKEILDNLKDVDVIIAPIADNTMYTILDDFVQGKITNLQCINALSANRLGLQYVFLNDQVINDNLTMLERCYYSSSEKRDYQAYRLKETEIGKNKVKIAIREYAGIGKYIEEIL